MSRLNNGLLKQCCCYPILVQGLCRAAKRAAIQHLTAKKGTRPDLQVSLYLNIIFNLILFNQNDPSFAHEIESTRFEGSSLAVIILDLITEFNEQPDSPFPVKKLLLVLWKVLNTTLGSMSTLKKQKQDLLKKMGVPTPNGLFSTKSRLEDFETLKRDAERHQHNIIFEMPDSAAHAKYLTIKRTKGLDFINNKNNNNDDDNNNNNNNNNNMPEYPPLSPRPAHVDSPFVGAIKKDIPKRESDIPKLDLESKLFSEKYMRQTLRLPPALGEAFRIMEKNLYIPPATLQHPEFQQGLEALLSKKAPQPAAQAHTTLPRILQHPDSTTVFERIYRQILPNLANHLVFMLKIMLAAAPTVKNYAGTINLNLEGPGPESQRHREIVLKACTAILLLLLKHARFNSLQQFSHIRNIMIDAKAVLLMLKLINHDLNIHIATAADSDDPPPEPEILKQTYLPGSFRNFFSMTGVLRILQKLTKKNGVALRILHQYKAPAILKKTLETNHHSVRLYTLKSLVPYLPRKWRAMNMKIVSEIYFYVRLDTRDDWLSGDPDLGSKDAQEAAQVEEFLRTQYIEWWQHMKHGPKDRIIYGLDEPLGMDPVQALLAQVELDDEWKNHWEEWVAWEERGAASRENMFKSTP